tara:strand:+ start:70 stop:300 length:231 start_codon:yes stop_codon:yes gene_type:complete
MYILTDTSEGNNQPIIGAIKKFSLKKLKEMIKDEYGTEWFMSNVSFGRDESDETLIKIVDDCNSIRYLILTKVVVY